MCGIWALLGVPVPGEVVDACLRALDARGPDASRHSSPCSRVQLGFTRLAINGLTTAGMQPFTAGHSMLHCVCNGEIYNFKQLAAQHGITLTTGSDCEVILPLWKQFSCDAVTLARSFDGVFAIVLVDISRDEVVVMRDPFGVRPLYAGTLAMGPGKAMTRVWASEIKALIPAGATDIQPFPPGHVGIYRLSTGEELSLRRYHAVPWIKNPSLATAPEARAHLRDAFEAAVTKRTLSDRPIGCLLSGGLDSSLVAALLQRAMNAANPPLQLQTFSIGMSAEPGTDLFYARMVAKHIGSKHHEILVSEDDFFGAIPEVVHAIESYDITSVRASVGNYLVSKFIAKNTDIKVVFNGDGSDEASGSYLYFYNAPNDQEFEAEVERLLNDIHMFDVLRSDRSISSHGLEARTPFLDKQFVSVYLSIATELRRPRRAGTAGATTVAEKQLLREAFDGGSNPLLPSEVLWRRKEAFSDGVSKPERSWYTAIQERVKEMFPDDDAVKAECATYAPGPTAPFTAESLWYRRLFEAKYGPAAAATIPYFWLPRWSGGAKDPSARTLAVYSQEAPQVAPPAIAESSNGHKHGSSTGAAAECE